MLKSSMKIEVLEDKQAIAARAADIIKKSADDTSGTLAVALAGGTTPRVLYSLLSSEPLNSSLPWSRLKWFFGDERMVPPDHIESNYRMAKETLFDPAGVDPAMVFRVKTELGEPQDVAADYATQVSENVPVNAGGVPVFDLVLLGMGADAHTASLFPHTSALAEYEKSVAPNFVPAMDTWRITLTSNVLLAAKQVVMMITGAEKANALATVLEGEENVNAYPSQLLKRRKSETIWLVDKAAASELRNIEL